MCVCVMGMFVFVCLYKPQTTFGHFEQAKAQHQLQSNTQTENRYNALLASNEVRLLSVCLLLVPMHHTPPRSLL
jgi:hypothetical protein